MAGRPDLKRDLQILRFIETFTQEHGYAPSQRQVMRGVRLKHLFQVQRSMARLKAAGRLHAPHLLVSASSEATRVPLAGYVAAGKPIEALENDEAIEVPTWMMKPKATYYALRVKGRSMIEDGILDRDLVLIRKQETAKNGDTVVALLNNEATLKRFYKRADRIVLKPANSEMAPLEVSARDGDFRIAGIFAGVLRSAE
jgi:repressor LexA